MFPYSLSRDIVEIHVQFFNVGSIKAYWKESSEANDPKSFYFIQYWFHYFYRRGK